MLIQHLIPMCPWAVFASAKPYSTRARSVDSGMLPAIAASVRAISEPASRPASCTLTPLAPASMVESIAFFIALGVGLIAVTVLLYVGWVLLSWRTGLLLALGVVLLALIISGFPAGTDQLALGTALAESILNGM